MLQRMLHLKKKKINEGFYVDEEVMFTFKLLFDINDEVSTKVELL